MDFALVFDGISHKKTPSIIYTVFLLKRHDMKLTNSSVKAAKLKDGKTMLKLPDDGGLYLLVNKSDTYWCPSKWVRVITAPFLYLKLVFCVND